MSSTLKRRSSEQTSKESKRAKIEVPEYHLAPQRKDSHGEIIWPARTSQIEQARDIILSCAKAGKKTVLAPDKDADGLSSGAILHHTLTTLGLSKKQISIYLLPKGANIHDETARTALSALNPAYVFVLDQGSRASPALIDSPHTALVIDHHFTTTNGFPQNAHFVTAHDCPPVATTALLTYHICTPLLPVHSLPRVRDLLSWLAVLGTHGDLGTSFKWAPPFPDMTSIFKTHTKKAINEAVSLVNAPRRSAAYNVAAAWDALVTAESPKAILGNRVLEEAQVEVKRETERCAHAAPRFSEDATVAVLEICSEAQVHPVVATRWAGTLRSERLEVVMCANVGYLPGRVNFSCRVAKCARAREGEIDIIRKLEGIVEGHPELRRRLGDSFARGHKEASGGVVGVEEWEEFKRAMGVGEGGGRKKVEKRKRDGNGSAQKNTLNNYFVKA
ncbi:DHH phosphoesterase [Sporormia fimetaria CBS 119925]|uniref:DHH phosphoesterase n=1 Tax=Sporormia fimetaria CBS 119925 TaxID=1340428 RepID=A0A6A6V4S2_9PLEO|nr:DHH phosphoesterase [Sporormia fimetaria CBS 119925]